MSNFEPTTGFMCKIDFDHEVGNVFGGSQVYATLEDLRECEPASDECGIVEVEIRLVEVVEWESF